MFCYTRKDSYSFSKGLVTQASLTRTKTLQIHALNWLNKRGCILCGAIQPIECLLFASLSFSLLLQWDPRLKHTHLCNKDIFFLSLFSCNFDDQLSQNFHRPYYFRHMLGYTKWEYWSLTITKGLQYI